MFPCWFLMAFLAPVGWALQQTPDTLVRLGDSLTLNCSHKESGIWTMYWYKQAVGKNTTMQLIVRSVEGTKADFEEEFKSRFQSSGTKENSLSVTIDRVLLSDSGTYFCASEQGVATMVHFPGGLYKNLYLQKPHGRVH